MQFLRGRRFKAAKRKHARSKHVLWRTLPLFKPYRWRLLLAAIFVSLTGLAMSSMPMFMRNIIDVKIPNKDLSGVIIIMAGFVAFMVVRMASWYAGQTFLLMIREQIIFKLRSDVFARLQELCLKFHNRYSPGYLYDRTLGGASTSVGMFLSMIFNNLITYLAAGISSLFFCLSLSPKLTILMFGVSLSYVATSKHFRRRIHKVTKAFNLENNEFAGTLTDLLRGVKTIKAFAMENRVIDEFGTRLWPLQMKSLDVNLEQMRLGFINEGLGYFISALITVAGAYLVIGSEVKIGTLVAFGAYQSMMIGFMSSLSNVTATYGSALAGLEQIYEVMDAEPSVIESPHPVHLDQVEGRLTIENLHFGYDDRSVMNGVNLEIPAGQSIALVGPSGGGKTTLVNLLLRLYDPDDGCIKLDGRDIRDLSIEDYRSQFGVVLQDPFLFNESIYDNLIAVKPDATEAEVRSSLERAQAWEFINGLEGGWNFKVGEGGSQVSGGQRQRIALARCILTNPKIMVLDEATSALDNQSEALVQTAIDEIMRDRTFIVIAHRLSTVRNVDRIIVLQNGRIVQDGSFNQLCREPGIFRDLHMLAFKGLSTGAADGEMQDAK